MKEFQSKMRLEDIKWGLSQIHLQESRTSEPRAWSFPGAAVVKTLSSTSGWGSEIAGDEQTKN